MLSSPSGEGSIRYKVTRNFYNDLHRQLILALKRRIGLSHEPLLFLTVHPPEKKLTSSSIPYQMVYGGLKSMRQHVCNAFPQQVNTSELNRSLYHLKKGEIDVSENGGDIVKKYIPPTKAAQSFRYIYEQATGSISRYFSSVPTSKSNKPHEKLFLQSAAIPIDDYYFLSLPIKIDHLFFGVVHIVMHRQDAGEIGFEVKDWDAKGALFSEKVKDMIAIITESAENAMRSSDQKVRYMESIIN